MTKADIVNEIAKRTGLEKATVLATIENFMDVVKAVLLCFFEVCILRFIMAFVRATAFIGYKKKKMNWGRIERQKINIK